MKVAVTGGSGFVGTRLVQGLVDGGHTVHVLVRNVEHALSKLPPGVTGAVFRAGEPLGPEALAGAEAVVHLAGEPVNQRWTHEGKRRIHESRVQGTRALVEAMRAAGTVRRFVSVSAVGYYGGTRSAEPKTEESPPGEDFLASVCRDWEAEASRAREAGISTAVVRMGAVLHPEGGALHAMLPPFRMGAGGRVGSGKQYVSWIHREDALAGLRLLVENPALEGSFNLSSPEPVTNTEFAHALGTALGRPSVMHVPGFVLKAALGEMSMMVLEGQRVVPRRLLEAGFTFQFPRLEEALKNLLA
ncbi:TIGR01777 family oxidoreductase [Hyalangium rubrum]|uniref:TIGR01777 family oxidoreductase n=1 Tax=Hyalangium rubrum TaxID=3103134 RepID=A0ABU5HI28_9BACT|nr:TIGR01777 family oxidoreductase [Hyalangium sp. s54d21]MDY7232807.1 TIGR01777 family oxidoreductase [Hyalangium sp. s54d21]